MSEHKLHRTKEIFMPRARIELGTRLHFAINYWWLDGHKNNGENSPKEKETWVKRWSSFEQLRPVEHLLRQ